MTSSLDSATKLALLNLADHLGDEVGQVGAIVARLGTGLFNDIAAEVVLPPSEVSGRDRLADQVAAQKRELVQRALLVMITHGIVKTNTDPDGVRYEFVVERAVMRLRFPYFVKHVRREMCCFVPAAAMDSRRGAYDDVAARLVRVLLLHGRLQQPTLLRFVEEDLLRQSRERREAGDAAASSVPSDDEAELRAVLQETFDELFRRRYFRYFGDGDGGDLDEDSDSSAKRRHESSSAASRKRARSVREDLARMERYDQQLSCEAFSLPLEINVEQLNDELLVQQCLRFARLRPSSTVDASELLLEEEGSGEEEEEGESEEEEEEEEEVAPRGRAASMATQGADAAVAGSIELTLSAIFSIVGGLAGAFKQARGDEEYGGGYGDDGVSFKVTTLRKEIKNRAHAAQVELDRIKSLQGSASYSAEEEGSSSSGGGGGSSSADIDALREARKVLLRRRVKFGTLQVRDVDRLCSRLAKIEVVGNAGDVPVMEDSESHFRNQSQQSSDDMMRRRGILYNIGNKLWALNVMKLLNCMHEFSIESVVRGKFGVHSARIFRFLAQQGYLDDDAIAKGTMLDNKESRQRVYAMFTAKFLTLQEVQKTVVRSQYLWTVRPMFELRRLVIDDICMGATQLLAFRSIFTARDDVVKLFNRDRDDRIALRRKAMKAALLASGGSASSESSEAAVAHTLMPWEEEDRAKLEQFRAALIQLDSSMLRLDETLLLLGALRALERL